jgi:transcriptional regulator NrdR family protein
MDSAHNGERKEMRSSKEAVGLLRRRLCSECGNEHVNVTEWKKCMKVTQKHRDVDEFWLDSLFKG